MEDNSAVGNRRHEDEPIAFDGQRAVLVVVGVFPLERVGNLFDETPCAALAVEFDDERIAVDAYIGSERIIVAEPAVGGTV